MDTSYSTKTCWGYWKAGAWMETTRSTEGRATKRNMEKGNKWRNGKVWESMAGSEDHSDISRTLKGSHRGPMLHKGVKGDWLIDRLIEWTSGPVWALRSEEKYPSLRLPGSNQGRTARSLAPCRLSFLAHSLISWLKDIHNQKPWALVLLIPLCKSFSRVWLLTH